MRFSNFSNILAYLLYYRNLKHILSYKIFIVCTLDHRLGAQTLYHWKLWEPTPASAGMSLTVGTTNSDWLEVWVELTSAACYMNSTTHPVSMNSDAPLMIYSMTSVHLHNTV